MTIPKYDSVASKYFSVSLVKSPDNDGNYRNFVHVSLTHHGNLLCDFIENEIIPYCNRMKKPALTFIKLMFMENNHNYMYVATDQYYNEYSCRRAVLNIDKPIDVSIIYEPGSFFRTTLEQADV